MHRFLSLLMFEIFEARVKGSLLVLDIPVEQTTRELHNQENAYK